MIEIIAEEEELGELLTWEEVYKRPGVYQNVNRSDAYLVITPLLHRLESEASDVVVNGAVWVTTYTSIFPIRHVQAICSGHLPGKRVWQPCDHLQLYVALKSESPVIYKVEKDDD